MNSIVIICALLASCQLALTKKDISSIYLFSDNSNKCQNQGLQCKDCETLQYCSNNEPLFEIRCGDQSKTRPYCDMETNTCVKDEPAVCNVEESVFICPDAGTYPDLENCNNYYICDEDKVPTNFACSAGYIYDHTIKGCAPGSFCKSYSSKNGQCKSKINKLVAYAPSKDLYILCLSGKHSMIFQCPVKNEVFNEMEVTCKFECVKNGFFSYPEDSTKFYSCVQTGKKFIMSLLDCPAGTEFVELGEGQGICTIKPETEAPVDEGSGEPEPEPEHEEQHVIFAENVSNESPESAESVQSSEN